MLTLDDLDPGLAELLTTQSYPPQAEIQGLQVLPLRELRDETGSFVELARLDELGRAAGLPEFQVRQVNYSGVLPGAVKAWHLHLGQEDLWFIPPESRLLAGFRDLRRESPSCGVLQRRILGAGQAQLVYIPRGVAHGVANPWAAAAAMFYLVNGQFQADQPDEHRLPWDAFGGDFWTLKRG